MLRFDPLRSHELRLPRAPLACAVLAAVLSAGCSADIARFDSPLFGLTENAGSSGSQTAPMPSASLSENRDWASPTGSDRTPRATSGIDRAPLDPAVAQGGPSGRVVPPLSPAPQPERVRTAAVGETIDVQPGDTLYGLSKRHGVPVDAIKRANNLDANTIKPGQKLRMPGSGEPPARMAAPAPKLTPAPAPSTRVPPAASAPPSTGSWSATYTVKPGDSLYMISRTRGIPLAELQRQNGITDVRKVMPGTVLKVPGEPAAPSRVASASPPPVEPPQPRQAPLAATPEPGPPSATPTIINAAPVPKKQVISLGTSEPEASSSAPPSSEVATTPVPPGKFRWPVRGAIIEKFGARADGSQNDGINIAVPLGTEVVAAEAGVVAYAGSELGGFGNLVLLRHDNGWVTAYAHNEEIVVRHNDKVRRGQVIAKAGKTGTVDQPQVHFELRHGKLPVDPTQHLEQR